MMGVPELALLALLVGAIDTEAGLVVASLCAEISSAYKRTVQRVGKGELSREKHSIAYALIPSQIRGVGLWA